MKSACMSWFHVCCSILSYPIVDEEMKHTLQALANPEIANDPQRYMEIMQRYKELHETQSIMAQRAGDRVVLKL